MSALYRPLGAEAAGSIGLAGGVGWEGDMTDWLTLDFARHAVQIFGILALLLTMLLGFMGVTKEYKDEDGKITRWGRYAAGAVLFSGALSLFSTLLRDTIAAAESAQQRSTQQARFDAQLKQMNDLFAATAEVQVGMRRSIVSQGALLTRSERGLEMSAQLTRQEQENSRTVLRRVWEDSNQVRPGDLSLSITYQCPRSRDGTFPAILPDDARASVSLTLPGEDPARDPWILLRASRHDSTHSERPTATGILFQQISHFAPLLGDLGLLRDAAAWRGVRMRASIVGQQTEIIRPDNVVARGWRTIPCKVTLVMVVAGRRAAFVEGELRQGVIDGRARINVRFPQTAILPEAIPALPI
jgi:hypothetical protein